MSKGVTSMRFTIVVDLTQDLAIIWKNISRKRRGDINRAKRRDVKVQHDQTRVFWSRWIELLKQSRKFIGLNPRLPNTLREKGYLFVAFHNNELIAAEYYHKRKKALITRLAASKRYTPEKKVIAGLGHALLIWEAIQWAKAQGFQEFDLGGYNPKRIDVSGVNEWKASFGGEPVKRPKLR